MADLKYETDPVAPIRIECEPEGTEAWLRQWIDGIAKTAHTCPTSETEVEASVESLYAHCGLRGPEFVVFAESPRCANQLAAQLERKAKGAGETSCADICETISEHSLREADRRINVALGAEIIIPSFKKAIKRTGIYSEIVFRESVQDDDGGRLQPNLGCLYLGSSPRVSFFRQQLGDGMDFSALDNFLFLVSRSGHIYFGADYCVVASLPVSFAVSPTIENPESFSIRWTDGWSVRWNRTA